ncbi:MAG: DUF454 domain-containing protein [Deltaproteobacteria bacterium]|nr:MAG: DUF454 domain-containing protein [Deltaproteobacteria bacterium]
MDVDRDRAPRVAPEGAGGGDELRERWERRRGRFGEDARAHHSPLVRALYVAAGTVSLVTGVIGILVPVLPTTPFILVATACYVKASPRLYDKILSNRVVGFPVYTWQVNRTVPRRVRVVAVTVVLLTFSTTIAFAVKPLWARLLMAALGLGLATFLWRLPTTRSPKGRPSPDDARDPQAERRSDG